jgi:predicted MFS family arabinose efflux permease
MDLWGDIRSAFHNRGAILIIIASVFIFGGPTMSVINTYLPLFLQNALGIGSIETSIVYSVSMVGGILGGILFGRVSTRIGGLRTLVILIGLASLLDFLLVLHSSFSIILGTHLFFVGFTSFASNSLIQAHIANIATTPRQRDIIVGILFTSSNASSPIISIIIGLLLDFYQTFNAVWIFKALLGTIAFCILLLALRNSTHERKL